MSSMRVGMGFDSHRFSDDAGRRLVLGGVVLAGERGLHGHSDADVVAHAVADALLGPAGLPDLGAMFPAGDERWAGADSMALLAQVASAVGDRGWGVANVDCTVVLEAPRIGEHCAAMAAGLGKVVGAPVGVRAKSPEGLGALGRAEGIACWAVALLLAP